MTLKPKHNKQVLFIQRYFSTNTVCFIQKYLDTNTVCYYDRNLTQLNVMLELLQSRT